ncbi:MAG: AAA family ATPase, partial [Proteobacteria bacterium]|nr:AAA family ATPase [Pseudomonadota bacterium]
MDNSLAAAALRIAEALERLAPPAPPPLDLTAADAFVWHPAGHRLAPVPRVARVDIGLLKGVEHQKAIVL